VLGGEPRRKGSPGNLWPHRRLCGITYWVREIPEETRKLVTANIRKECESDILDWDEDHEHGSQLRSLPRRRWGLRVVASEDIKPAGETMTC
jgi:hypothetical protein